MIEHRIAYYTRKVAEFGAIHITKKRNPYRDDRLMAYKKLMHNQIEVEREHEGR